MRATICDAHAPASITSNKLCRLLQELRAVRCILTIVLDWGSMDIGRLLEHVMFLRGLCSQLVTLRI